jgi:Flp pilus assembly protein TadD
LRRLERPDEAILCYRKVIALRPDHAEAHNNLGNALRQCGRLEEAAACYRRTIALQPAHAEAHSNLGVVLDELEQPDEAAACHRKALDIRPGFPLACNNLGVALRKLGQLDAAIACYRRAIELRPDYPEAHCNLAMALLARGDLAAGWDHYEWRWSSADMTGARRAFKQPQWLGRPGEGATLLIHAEQGFGDTLQFCRYAPLAAERGFRVVMEVQPALVRLLRGLPRVDRVVAHGDALPPFDLHCPMLSLPRAFGTTLADIPARASYLCADAGEAEAWRARLAGTPGPGPWVGLAWAGNPRPHSPALAATDRRRSLPPERLAPLFGVPGLQFCSLQKDNPGRPENFPLFDGMGEMRDFADTAALIANLDLVIAVDTAVAHLAAALGKPVWLLNRFDQDWRWLTDRQDSPWYPTLRIYRQPRRGDWASVIAEVAHDLRRFARRRSAVPAQAFL